MSLVLLVMLHAAHAAPARASVVELICAQWAEKDGVERVIPSYGSGVVVPVDGVDYLVTAFHVSDVDAPGWITGGEVRCEAFFFDGHRQTVSMSVPVASTDLDVLAFPLSKVGGYVRADIGDPGLLDFGTPVLVVGNAMARGISQAVGYVRQPHSRNQGLVMVQGGVSPGNSGGGMFVTTNGQDDQLVAITLAKERASAEADDIGYGYRIDDVVALIAERRRHPGARRVHFGLELENEVLFPGNDPLRVSAKVAIPIGVLVTGVSGPAAEAGILPGDRIIEVDGATVRSTNDVVGILERLVPGRRVVWVVDRSGARHEIPVTGVAE